MASLETQWDLGPNLEPPTFFGRSKSIFIFALKNHFIQIIIISIALILLLAGISSWDVLLPPLHFQNGTEAPAVSPTNWGDWMMRVQSFFGVATLLVALFLWHRGIREEWESHLPKKMSVFFFYQGRPAIVCRYVWLAGEDDLRAWGQQVAAQAAYKERYLEFSPEIRTKNHSLIFDLRNGMICNHYEICFKLCSLPPSLSNDRESCRYQNLDSENKKVQSIPSGTVATLACVSSW